MLYTPFKGYLKPTGQRIYKELAAHCEESVRIWVANGHTDKKKIESYMLANMSGFINANRQKIQPYCIHDFSQLFKEVVYNVCNDTYSHWLRMNVDTFAGDEQEETVKTEEQYSFSTK